MNKRYGEYEQVNGATVSDLFYTTDGQNLHEPLSIEQITDAVLRDGAFLIKCGFLP